MHSQLRSNVYTQSTEVRLIHTLSNGDTDIYTHSIEVSLIHTLSNGDTDIQMYTHSQLRSN